MSRTLTNEEVNAKHEKVLERVVARSSEKKPRFRRKAMQQWFFVFSIGSFLGSWGIELQYTIYNTVRVCVERVSTRPVFLS